MSTREKSAEPERISPAGEQLLRWAAVDRLGEITYAQFNEFAGRFFNSCSPQEHSQRLELLEECSRDQWLAHLEAAERALADTNAVADESKLSLDALETISANADGRYRPQMVERALALLKKEPWLAAAENERKVERMLEPSAQHFARK